MKATVIQRIRQAQTWCRQHGVAYDWLGTLLADAAQELEGESGALWCQWMTGRQSHVRIFVTGELGPRELDSLIEMLTLSRSWMETDKAASLDPSSVPAATVDAP